MAKDTATTRQPTGQLLYGWEKLLPGVVFFACGIAICGMQFAAHGFVSTYGLIEAAAFSAAVVTINLYAVKASQVAALPSREAELRLAVLARAAGQLLADSQVQTGLEANMNDLRSRLEAFGMPRREGDQLYYGDRLINDDTEIVDEVARAHGGLASVILGNRRIATNELGRDGTRAVGAEFEEGPAQEALYVNGRIFVGEAVIFEKNHLSIYEPIAIGEEVVGALFVGVERVDKELLLRAIASYEDRAERMLDSIESLHSALAARAEVEAAALADRSAFAEAARRAEAERTRVGRVQSMAMEVLSRSLKLFAQGDLTVRLGRDFPAEFARLREDFNEAAERLMGLVRSVVSSAGSIHSTTTDISTSADELARRTEQQAANLEETAAVLSSLTESVKKSAEGSERAAKIAEGADREAKQGGVVVRRAVEAMQTISDSSHQISQIIGVIDEIAFQTNLLALNAGVEAARAGESGRGFAVVAAEVRVLAQRCALAAKDIKDLIQKSSQQVDSGVEMVSNTGEALDRIITQASEIHRVVVDISETVKEQAIGLHEVNVAMGQMDTMTQQNATMVDESSAATRSLSSETKKLAELVAQFRTGDEGKGGQGRSTKAAGASQRERRIA
ncbi:MAG: methyl-accepting chemotaxis protein [Methylocystis sp.]|uniref:methyl-accepting chemotaxis protein n=1 Tax=Methylocystis sp. TaxID=1911079 RepID=UPI003DA2EDBF